MPEIGPHDQTQPLGAEEAASLQSDSSAPGANVGRFVVEGVLGSGGMGIVLAARDPALDRRVALKLLRPDVCRPGDEEARARLQREAQAMARVQHPNVATVYEVGAVGDQVFVAMELVDGQTLGGWLSDRPRGAREIVEMLRATGRGLEAAHAAGLVHRDFKPDNVLVGRDGRPRVSDFGLVSVRPRAVEEAGASGLTLQHAGTPAYMAPEQLDGKPADARADQFSFAVTLYEALWGERPFDPQARGEARRAPESPPRGREVPAYLFPIVARGMATRPEDRWPRLGDLLEALARDPAAVRRRRLGALAMVLALGAAGWGLWHSRAPDCGGAAARLAGVWDDARKAEVRAAFAGTALTFAEDTFSRVAARIDQYARGWVDMHEEACRATRVEGRQSDTLLDLRMECLGRRRSELHALTTLWSRGVDAVSVEHALDAAGALPPLADCADARGLGERVPLPGDAAARARIRTAEARVDELRALTDSYRYLDARRLAPSARADAEATGWPGVRAEAAFETGRLSSRFLSPESEEQLADAAELAETARDDRLAARALMELGAQFAEDQRDGQRALLTARVAEGVVARAGGDDELAGRLDMTRGVAFMTLARYDDARRAFLAASHHLAAAPGLAPEQALAPTGYLARIAADQGNFAEAKKLQQELLGRYTKLFGPAHPQVGSLLNNLGSTLWRDKDPAAAELYQRRAVVVAENAFGPDGAPTANALANLAVIEQRLQHADESERLNQRALAIREKVFGPESVWVAESLGNLSSLRADQMRVDESLALARRALAIIARVYPPDHPSVAFAEEMVGDELNEKDDLVPSAEHYRRGFEARQKSQGPNHPETLDVMRKYADVLMQLHRDDEGFGMMRDLVKRSEAAEGPDGEHVAGAVGLLGSWLRRRGRPAEALPLLERALAVCKLHPGTITPAFVSAMEAERKKALRR
jgi:eukaryotic-like serine/threonine-protein kinase